MSYQPGSVKLNKHRNNKPTKNSAATKRIEQI